MNEIIKTISDFLWNYILLFALLGVGIFLSFKLKFPQITKLWGSVKKLIQDIKDKVEVPDGCMTPLQSLTTAVAAQVGTGNIVGVILIGGMQRIAKFSERVVPVMAFAYILGSIVIILMNLDAFLPSLRMIFVGAFTPQAIAGGALGITVQEAARFGLARGLFSNEAGMGSTPHSHAVAQNDHPADQGFIAMIGVFISTFLICMSTVMVNMVSGSYSTGIPAAEMSKDAVLMTQNGFVAGFGSLAEFSCPYPSPASP